MGKRQTGKHRCKFTFEKCKNPFKVFHEELMLIKSTMHCLSTKLTN